MKKMLFSAIAMVAFTLSANAQYSSDPKTNGCFKKAFEAADKAEEQGKVGGEIADAANKAYNDCMGIKPVVSQPKDTKTATPKQPNTISR